MERLNITWDAKAARFYVWKSNEEKPNKTFFRAVLHGGKFVNDGAFITANSVVGYYPITDVQVTRQIIYDHVNSKRFVVRNSDKTLGFPVEGASRLWLLSLDGIPHIFSKVGELLMPKES